jgi:hypothetical protein
MQLAVLMLIFQAVNQVGVPTRHQQGNFAELQEPHVVLQVNADCATIEKLSDDDGMDGDSCRPLTCAQEAISASIHKPVPEHQDNGSAASNLKDCFSQSGRTGIGVIIGHGASELIYTGPRNNAAALQKANISSSNQKFWTDILKKQLGKQGKTSMLTLLACSTGMGSGAAAFLGKVGACSGAMMVTAPTQDVFCADKTLYFLGQGQWLTVQPSKDSCPTSNESQNGMSKNVPGAQEQISSQNIIWQNTTGIHLVSYEATKKEFDLTVTELSTFLNDVVRDRALRDDGCPVTRKIGRVTLKFSDDSPPLSLTVFSNGLLHDLSRHDTHLYYFTQPQFFAHWKGFIDARSSSK